MKAHKVGTVLSADRTLILQGLPFNVSDAVEVIIVERSLGVSIGGSPNQAERL
jgi:hypothetical protein